MQEPVTAAVSLRRAKGVIAGTDRIALLDTIRSFGSIAKAAKHLGLSYRTAWDGVRALNNLFEKPLVIAEPGGRDGGSARVTPDGEEVIRFFRLLEIETGNALDVLRARLIGSPDRPAPPFAWELTMRTTARNVLHCSVVRIIRGPVDAEVSLAFSAQTTLTAVITDQSVDDLELAIGSSVFALVNPTFVIIAKEEEVGRTSARNRLSGVISCREDGTVNSEIVLDIGASKTLTASITTESARELDFKVGDRACALIKASHVILMAK